METERTIEVKTRYNKNTLRALIDLTNEDPLGKTSTNGIIGNLRVNSKGGYLQVSYSGRRDIARRLEIYVDMVNKADESITSAFQSKSTGAIQ